MKGQAAIADSWRERLGDAGIDSLDLLLAEQTPDHVLPGALERLSKPGLGGRERWRWSLPNGHGPVTLYLKRYRESRWGVQWDRLFRQNARHSRGWWEYHISQRLREAHVPAPDPVGFAERMLGRLETCSAVVVASVNGDAFDRVWLRAAADNAAVIKGHRRQDLVRRLARFVAAFHGTGFCHRDLYLCHVFVHLDPEGTQPPSFALIDLARAHRPRWRHARWLIKDLAQLDYSARQVGACRSDRYRFLLAYLGLLPGSMRVRWYARRIVRKSDAILRREQRKGRA